MAGGSEAFRRERQAKIAVRSLGRAPGRCHGIRLQNKCITYLYGIIYDYSFGTVWVGTGFFSRGHDCGRHEFAREGVFKNETVRAFTVSIMDSGGNIACCKDHEHLPFRRGAAGRGSIPGRFSIALAATFPTRIPPWECHQPQAESGAAGWPAGVGGATI